MFLLLTAPSQPLNRGLGLLVLLGLLGRSTADLLSFLPSQKLWKLRHVVSRAELISHAFSSSWLNNCNSIFTCLYITSLNLQPGRQTLQNWGRQTMSLWFKKTSVSFRILTLAFKAVISRIPQYISVLLVETCGDLVFRVEVPRLQNFLSLCLHSVWCNLFYLF